MKNYLLHFVALFLALCLTSCFQNKIFYLKSDQDSGLKDGDEVRIKGYRAGSVDKVYLTKDFQSLVKIHLDEDILIPLASRFTIESTDLVGTKAINIIPGKSKKYIAYGDTLELNTAEMSASQDSLSSRVGHFIDRVIKSDKDDSLIREIQKLNKKVQELDRDLKNK